MIAIRLEYQSPEFILMQEIIQIPSECTTDELEEIIEEIVKLRKSLFKLYHKKDGFEKLIISGWSSQSYDIESQDVIRIVPKSQDHTQSAYQSFLFKESVCDILSETLNDYFERAQSSKDSTLVYVGVFERIPELIAKGQQDQVFVLLLENIENRPESLNLISSDGWALIHHMVYYDCETYLGFILREKIKCDINLPTLDGWTPLMFAVRQQNLQALRTILSFPGLKVNLVTSRATALHMACKMGDQRMVRMLIQAKADPLQKNLDGINSYQIANPQMKQFLVSLTDGERQSGTYLNQLQAIICKGKVVCPGDFVWQIKKRFLFLNPMEGTLKRFAQTDTSLSSPREIISISQISQIKGMHQQFGLSKDFYFNKIVFGNKSMVFGTETLQKAERWLTMIRLAIVYQKNVQSKLYRQNLYIETEEIDLDESQDDSVRETVVDLQQQINIKYEQKVANMTQSLPAVIRNIDHSLQDIVVPQRKQEKTKLQDFVIQQTIGQGAFGIVFLATHKYTKKTYALKVMNKLRLLRKKQLKYAINESKILQIMDHPFVLKLWYAFQTPKNFYMAIDYCPGSDLYGCLSKLKRFPEQVAKFYICEILVALEYLHSKDIVYRDLKPENVLLCFDGHIKLADFGLSKLDVAYEVDSRSFCGSPAYMSPETLLKVKVGKYMDYYALGIVMYELLSGLPPFIANQLEAIYEMIKSSTIRFPVYMSDNARDLIRKFTVKDPKQRLSFTEAKSHPFFSDIDWNRVITKKYKPPIIPDVKGSDGMESEPVMFEDEDYTPETAMQNLVKGFDFKA